MRCFRIRSYQLISPSRSRNFFKDEKISVSVSKRQDTVKTTMTVVYLFATTDFGMPIWVSPGLNSRLLDLEYLIGIKHTAQLLRPVDRKMKINLSKTVVRELRLNGSKRS